MNKLWSKESEKEFFQFYLQTTEAEKLFYMTDDNRFVAYWPKGYSGSKSTLQSRNGFIGTFTELWVQKLFAEIAKEMDCFAVNHIICTEIGLNNQSPGDLAICTTIDRIQKPQNIKIICEVKMSIVWNWEYIPSNNQLKCIGDYKSHLGTPGLLRSDTMLKAIGKSVNIRVSGRASERIPIIVIGNTPITSYYYEKVDYLKQNGIVQRFISINPKPLDSDTDKDDIVNTERKGFQKINNLAQLKALTLELLGEEQEFFSSMKSRKKLGELINISNKEETYEKKAGKFLELLRMVEK